ncbi:two-component regulator propeller domain-containing protein [Maribacter sp. 2-571]|uniref:two-component regulator propeller domain-containing protein n=1 Tax=Maribacter sp. 2-571 TaxID=3417569 RepID=UPI003D328AB7
MRFPIWLVLFICCRFLGYGQPKPLSFQPIKNGLSNEWVSCITQDQNGFIWVGTQDGLHRYDGYQFEVLRNSPENTNSIAANWIRGIAVDTNKNYWLATLGGGITRLSPKNMSFHNFSIENPEKNKEKMVSLIMRVDENYIAASSDEGYTIFNTKTNAHQNLNIGTFSAPMAFHEKKLWLVDTKNQLLSYDLQTKKSKLLHHFEENIRILEYIPEVGLLVVFPNKILVLRDNKFLKQIAAPKVFQGLTKTNNGNYYLFDSSTVYLLEPPSLQLKKVPLEMDLSATHISALFEDRQGTLWVGTSKGLFKEKKYQDAFTNQIPGVHARRILKHNNTLYFGGQKGLFKKQKGQFSQLLEQNPILGLHSDTEALYVSSDAPEIYKIVGDTLNKTLTFPGKSGVLRVSGLAKDRKGRLWAGTWEGLTVFDENDVYLKSIPLVTTTEIKESKIMDIHIDSLDRLWVITVGYGIYRIDDISSKAVAQVSSQVKNYTFEKGDPFSITSNIIMTMEEDPLGNLWFGSEIGLVRYKEEANAFERLQYQGSLFDKKIMSLKADNNQNVWISTISDGIYVHNTQNSTMQHFTESDGLMSDAFLYGSGFFDATNDTLYFGTDEGIQQISLQNYSPEIPIYAPQVTAFNVQDDQGRQLFQTAQVPFLQKVLLAPDQNDFSVRFSAMDFINPNKIRYSYKLDEDPWKVTDLQTAYFTNVPHGNHTLTIKPFYEGLSENKIVSHLDIYIAPSWYLTSLAKTIYVLLFLGVCFGFYRYLRWRWNMELNLKLKEEETERLQNLNVFKSKLYTNIAHEFKTPLTLISGPIEKELSNITSFDKDYSSLSMIKRNTQRLIGLVDQLLQLSKLEEGKLVVQLQEAELGLFIHSIANSFEYQADEKGLSYKTAIEPTGVRRYDEDIVEKIVTNLLSNAFKYTGQKGSCNIQLSATTSSIALLVKNTVQGHFEIQPEKLFDRFYQEDSEAEGMGVGLSLVKELVTLSKGTINAYMENENTIVFKVELPAELVEQPSSATQRNIHKNQKPNAYENGPNDEERPLLLVVEDHQEIRSFIRQSLQDTYEILEAQNGKVGSEVAFEKVPDIIVSDVRMPILDGIAMCNLLKVDERTSHIPIILLTGDDTSKMELKGLTSGADDFVGKPFKIRLLEKRIQNLISTRKALQLRYGQELILKPKNIIVNAADEVFLNKIQQILDTHLSEPTFNAAEFSKKAQMSRMQLHRKLLAFTGLSTSAFLRSQRLKQAQQLLQDSDSTINEVAYAVGFGTPSYFMKSFKESFGQTPSEYVASLDK